MDFSVSSIVLMLNNNAKIIFSFVMIYSRECLYITMITLSVFLMFLRNEHCFLLRGWGRDLEKVITFNFLNGSLCMQLITHKVT